MSAKYYIPLLILFSYIGNILSDTASSQQEMKVQDVSLSPANMTQKMCPWCFFDLSMSRWYARHQLQTNNWFRSGMTLNQQIKAGQIKLPSSVENTANSMSCLDLKKQDVEQFWWNSLLHHRLQLRQDPLYDRSETNQKQTTTNVQLWSKVRSSHHEIISPESAHVYCDIQVENGSHRKIRQLGMLKLPVSGVTH